MPPPPPPLWYNSSLAFKFRKEWANKGYFLIKDILDEEGALLTLNDLQTRDLKINFLDYITLKFNFQKMKGTCAVTIFNSALNAWAAMHSIRPHYPLPPSFLGMDVWMTSQLSVALIRKLR